MQQDMNLFFKMREHFNKYSLRYMIGYVVH